MFKIRWWIPWNASLPDETLCARATGNQIIQSHYSNSSILIGTYPYGFHFREVRHFRRCCWCATTCQTYAHNERYTNTLSDMFHVPWQTKAQIEKQQNSVEAERRRAKECEWKTAKEGQMEWDGIVLFTNGKSINHLIYCLKINKISGRLQTLFL